MPTQRLVYLVPLLLFAVVAGYLMIGLRLDPGKLPSALIDKPVPEFALPGLEGVAEGLATADLKAGDGAGQANGVSVVNVFASWCVPCRAEHPYLMRLAKEGVTVHGINYQDKPEDARGWLARLGNPYTRIGADRDGRASIDWGVYGVPETFVVDGSGRIRFKQVGPITTPGQAETLRAKIAEAGQ